MSGGNTVYAIVQTGGHQYKVAPGDVIEVERLEAEPGSQVELGEVLMVSGDDGVQVGTPTVSGAKVIAKVLSQGKSDKLVILKFKPKKRSRRKTGHRQNVTMLSIKEISI